jgi:hypothetical protein
LAVVVQRKTTLKSGTHTGLQTYPHDRQCVSKQECVAATG